MFAVSRGWRRNWQPRQTEPGRYLSGPPAGLGFGDWADVLEGAGMRAAIRRKREAEDRRVAELEAAGGG